MTEKIKKLLYFHIHRTDEEQCIKYYHGFVIESEKDLKNKGDILKIIRRNEWPLPKK